MADWQVWLFLFGLTLSVYAFTPRRSGSSLPPRRPASPRSAQRPWWASLKEDWWTVRKPSAIRAKLVPVRSDWRVVPESIPAVAAPVPAPAAAPRPADYVVCSQDAPPMLTVAERGEPVELMEPLPIPPEPVLTELRGSEFEVSDRKQKAIERWARGEALSQNDMAALIGGNKQACLNHLRAVKEQQKPKEAVVMTA